MNKIETKITVTKVANGYIVNNRNSIFVVAGNSEIFRNYIAESIFKLEMIEKMKEGDEIAMEFIFDKNPPKSV